MHPREVHVWRMRLDLPPSAQCRIERLLSAGERARAGRFVNNIDGRRYAAAHGLLRVVLSRYVGIAPGDIPLETRAGGKPQFADRSAPRFNLSHSGGIGLVAVCATLEVGVDVEEIRNVPALDALVESCFSPDEQAAFKSVEPGRQLSAFYAGWTQKEAVVKMLGHGLSMAPGSFDASIYAPRVLHPAPGYAAAIAIEAPAQ